MIDIVSFTCGMVPSYIDVSLCRTTTDPKQSVLIWLKEDRQDYKLWFMLYIGHQAFLSYTRKITTDLKEFCTDHFYIYGDKNKNGIERMLKALDNMENYV